MRTRDRFPRVIVSFGAVLSLLLLPGVLGTRRGFAQELNRFERERAKMMLRIVKDDVDRYYYDPAYHGVDLKSSFAAADEKIDHAASISQAFAMIARPLLELKDSHTFFIPPARSVRLDFGWVMEMIGDHCYVMAVEQGSDAEAKGLKRGDEVIAEDGHRPTRDNLWGLDYVYRILAPRPTVHLQVQSPGQPAREIEVAARVEEKKNLLRLTSSADFEDYVHDLENRAWLGRHRIQEMGEDLSIWKMPEFDMRPSEVRSTMRSVMKHKALILDLRGNPGGSIETLEAMVGSFLDGEVKFADPQSRQRMKPLVAKAIGDPFTGKLVVLIDSKSASSSELFARTMQLEKRAVVLGDRSAGEVMMARPYPHGIGSDTQIFFAAQVTIANLIMKDGQSLEGVGVAPDEVMLPTAEDLAGGSDPVLAHAASLCGVTLDAKKAGSFFPVEWKR
ncbi:MAG TPA: S41 family peptidase [Candidatus Polarisedimenticolia bacterium]|nr:S41 family peptidase [Candidatus Polarisedimenticolia bacterium]